MRGTGQHPRLRYREYPPFIPGAVCGPIHDVNATARMRNASNTLNAVAVTNRIVRAIRPRALRMSLNLVCCVRPCHHLLAQAAGPLHV